jgi:hypothetical protein
MTEFDYHVIALVPPNPPFDLQAAIEALRSARYKAERTERGNAVGIRVVEDDGWAIVAWLEDDDEARILSRRLSELELPNGVTSEQIFACSAHLSIWSDDDSDRMNAHVFEEFIQFLKERFGLFIFDNRLGEWR